MRSKKVIVDTNIWISFLITKKFEELDELIIQHKIVFIFSKELIEEFLSVVSRPKFQRYFSNKNIQRLLLLFDEYGQLSDVQSNLSICRDKKDDFLLNLAVDSQADYLVSGDADLLVLVKIGKTKICKWSDFITSIRSGK
ncbi:MAG: putative toxin-antitoxin system toxin component, PIN family [Prolixibacteraceae bacterium]